MNEHFSIDDDQLWEDEKKIRAWKKKNADRSFQCLMFFLVFGISALICSELGVNQLIVKALILMVFLTILAFCNYALEFRCPFCNGKMKKRMNQDYIKACPFCAHTLELTEEKDKE